MTAFKRPLLCLFSAGWLAPLWLGIDTYLEFQRLEVLPRLVGHPEMHSFPFVQFSQKCFAIALGWLALVILFWVWRVATPASRR